MTTDSTPAPEGEPVLPDEVWDRFLRDTERDIRADAPKEPSARARLVARRLREEEERAAESRRRRGWRSRRRPMPRSWRSGVTDATADRLRRRGRLRALAGIALVVLLLVIVLAPGRAWSFAHGDGWHDNGAPAPAPTAGIPRTAAGPTFRVRPEPTLRV